MQIILLLTLLTVLPAVVMSVTPFLRITVVLHFLRQALGTQTTPSNQVLVGLALFLTILIMQPVVIDMYRQGWEPLESGQLTWQCLRRRVPASADIPASLRTRKRPAPVLGYHARGAAEERF